MYSKEYAKDFINKVGPGPGYYNLENSSQISSKESRKNNFTIPKVSIVPINKHDF